MFKRLEAAPGLPARPVVHIDVNGEAVSCRAGESVAAALLAAGHDAFVTVEEACVMGGAGSAVTELLGAHGLCLPVLQLGLPDAFIDHGEQAALLRGLGLDAAGIERSVRERFQAMLAPRSVVSLSSAAGRQ